MTVGLVLVSHSAKLAEGVAELAGQMAPGVRIVPAGGMSDGGIGTDYDAVSAALDRAEGGAGVVLLYDLGSAQMIAELAVEGLGDPDRAFVVDAPFVEGAVAAAVAASGGANLDDVAAAAAAAGGMVGPPVDVHAHDVAAHDVAGQDVAADVGADVGAPGVRAAETAPTVRAEVLLRNEVGLHARPAAVLARSIADLRADVRIRYGGREADARSVLALMELGAGGGALAEVTASGEDAAEAVRKVTALADNSFNE